MRLKSRRIFAVLMMLGLAAAWVFLSPYSYDTIFTRVKNTGAEAGINYEAEAISAANPDAPLASEILEKLEVKGRAPKTGYSREQFYDGWPTVDGCNLRQRVLKRELGDSAVLDGCYVVSGEYAEPYTGEYRVLENKEDVAKIQIDHVVALSDAWQKGAQYKDYEVRNQIATDPLNLLAVDGPANEQKSDGDAATWLPKNKKFRCQYVARQVSVKYKYGLWVTEAEKQAISKVLENCPNEPAIGV